MGVTEILATAAAIVAALCGAIVKLWLANQALRLEAAAERDRAQALEDRINREHKRDLRWALGMPTSLDPPPMAPVVIRGDDRPQPPRPSPRRSRGKPS